MNKQNTVKEFKYRNIIVTLTEGDICTQKADVVVNAANETLIGEDGVDGAIHLAAGPNLQKECNKTGYCAVTDVVITNAYQLPAKYVFHTVGPQWNGDAETTELLLRITYYNNLRHAERMQMNSIVFPSISTGQYGVPTAIGAQSFTNAIRWFTDKHNPRYATDVRMITWYDPDFDESTDAFVQYTHHLTKLSVQNSEN